jgi:hypothetical protein
LGVLLAATLAGPLVAAATASATAWDPVGSIEICKTSVTGTLAVTGPFTFNVTGGTITSGNGSAGNTVTVGTGTCSPVLGVTVTAESGDLTITEPTASWYKVSAITGLPGSTYLQTTGTSVSGQTASVSVSATTTSVVTFQNTIVPGYVEVCKNAQVGSGLTGTFTFTVTSSAASGGSQPVANGPWTATATANVGACSTPVEMPAGNVSVTENGTNLYVTSITASNLSLTNALVSSNLVTGNAVVTEVPGDISTQTDVWFTNNVVAFKICKNWDPTQAVNNPSTTDPVSTYPFSYVATLPGATTGTTQRWPSRTGSALQLRSREPSHCRPASQ